MIIQGFLIVVLILTLAVSSNTQANDSNTHVIDIRDTPKDFKIPTKLWDLLLDIKTSSNIESDEKQKNEKLIVWLPLQVLFKAKASGTLIHDLIEYNFPRGGGSIDLSKVINGDKGTFFVKFNVGEFASQESVKVYFISNAKKRRFENEVFGAGCNVYYDVTDAVMKSLSIEGIKFNVTNNRHISALSGHFIFVHTEKDKVYLSHMEFTDSQNRDYLCKI